MLTTRQLRLALGVTQGSCIRIHDQIRLGDHTAELDSYRFWKMVKSRRKDHVIISGQAYDSMKKRSRPTTNYRQLGPIPIMTSSGK